MASLNQFLTWSPVSGLASVAGLPAVFMDGFTHLAVEQLLTDLLGDRQSSVLRVSASRDATRALLTTVADILGIEPGAPRFALSAALLRASGEGRVRLETQDGRRRGVGEKLHGSLCRLRYRELFGARAISVDSVMAGWLAAALEQALARPANTVEVRQAASAQAPDEAVFFDLGKGDGAEPRPLIWGQELDSLLGQDVPPVEPLTVTLREMLLNLSETPEGLLTFFSTPVALKQSAYHFEVVLAARQFVSQSAPGISDVLEASIVEAWRLGFAALLCKAIDDPTVTAVYPVPEDPNHVGMVAESLMQALGHGVIFVGLDPEGTFVAESAATAESLWSLVRAGVHERPANLAVAGMVQATADVWAVLSRGAPRGAVVWETIRTSPSAYQVSIPACISLGHVSCRVEAAPVQGAGQYVAV